MSPIGSGYTDTFEGWAVLHDGQRTAVSEDVGALQTIENEDKADGEVVERKGKQDAAKREMLDARKKEVAAIKEELASKRAQLAALRKELAAQRNSKQSFFSSFFLLSTMH